MPMKSYEALEQAINRRTREFAKRLGLSVSLLSKWQEPTADWSDSGAYNPLDRIEAIVQAALDLGTETKTHQAEGGTTRLCRRVEDTPYYIQGYGGSYSEND